MSGIRDALIKYFSDSLDSYEYVSGYLYKSGKRCISSNSYFIWETAHRGLYKLSEDYAALISKVYDAGFSENDRYAIAEALNEQFKRDLVDAVDAAYGLVKLTDEESAEALWMYFEV